MHHPRQSLFLQTLGRFCLNSNLIELSCEANVFLKDGRFNEASQGIDVSTFFHEYVHYLHNFSTLPGVTFLLLQHKLAGHLSSGLDILSPQVSVDPGRVGMDSGLAVTIARHDAFLGDHWDPSGILSNTAMVLEVRVEDGGRGLVLGSEEDGGQGAWLRIGYLALEESLAFELQSILLHALDDTDSLELLRLAPDYPYRTLRILGNSICPEVDIIHIVELAIASMSYVEFMRVFLEGLRRLSKDPGGAHDLVRVIVEEAPWSDIEAHVQLLADAFGEMYLNRGALEISSTWMQEHVVRMMRHRREKPFFEVDAARQGAKGVTDIVHRFVCCDVIQHFDDGTSALITFESSEDVVQARRAMHGHLEFAIAHLRDGKFVASSDTSMACSLLSVCDLPQKKNRPEACESAPWMHITLSTERRCTTCEGILMTFAVSEPARAPRGGVE